MSSIEFSYTKDNRDSEDEEAAQKLLNENSINSGFKLKNDSFHNSSRNEKDFNETENEETLSEEVTRLMKDMPLTKDTTCGFWIFKGSFLQRFANKNSYVILYGIVGCIFSMTYAYFNGTITTIEKRFKIPSKNTGIISVGNDISQLFVSATLSYYAGKGHRPRWIGFGLLTIVAFCLLTAAPHFMYGPGEDALSLTAEFGAVADENATMEALESQRSKVMCRNRGGDAAECVSGEGNLAPQVVLFLAQFISGIGGCLYYTLGVAYMDDNTQKSKTPALLSLSYFMRMLGPAMGYALASFCLRVYIAPQLRPVINNNDPRWLGAWWLGWLVIGGLLFTAGIFLTMFPKELPRAAARKQIEAQRAKKIQIAKKLENDKVNENEKEKNKEKEMEKIKGKEKEMEKEMEKEKEKEKEVEKDEESGASFKDMIKTFKRLCTNTTLMFNNFSSIFYLFGYTPYWIFTPKYIEIQYRQSASTSSLVTGTVALGFSALGILLSGFVISKFKPRARYMAMWNVIVGFLTVVGMLTYSFIGCPGNESSMVVNIPDSNSLIPTCNSDCQCDYVRYSPVCGEDGHTYISPCHAGCKKEYISNGTKIYYDCSCITESNRTTGSPLFEKLTTFNMTEIEKQIDILPTSLTTTSMSIYDDTPLGGQAIPGSCPVNCFKQFVTFLGVMCFLKFIGSSGRATNFLVSVRCVPEKDKTAAMGFGLMMMSLFAFIPSPIFFGWVLDRLCLVWGKTCSNKGNCWLYDPESLRFILNVIASIFVAIGALFDIGVWYYVKNLKIFDEEVKDTELEVVQHEEEANAEKKGEI